uniref:Uncharacterized protein n=1 Tax=Oryza brachyantha TaxID=4533 RepID=J3MAP0_ORYBR
MSPVARTSSSPRSFSLTKPPFAILVLASIPPQLESPLSTRIASPPLLRSVADWFHSFIFIR